MSKRTVIVSHGHPNNESWVEREFKRAMDNVLTVPPAGECPACLAYALNGGFKGYVCDKCGCLNKFVTVNKPRAMGKTEDMCAKINNINY